MTNIRFNTGYIIIYSFLFLTAIVPGYLFIFLFQKQYFFEWDLFRLTVISMSISLPILAINLAHLLKIYQTEDTDRNFINAIYKALLFSILVLYVPNIIGYFMDWNLVAGVAGMLVSQIVLSSVLVFARVNEAKL